MEDERERDGVETVETAVQEQQGEDKDENNNWHVY